MLRPGCFQNDLAYLKEFSSLQWMFATLPEEKQAPHHIDSSESGSENEEAMDAESNGLRSVIACYKPQDIFNMDENGMF